MSWTEIGYTVLDTTASTVSIAVPTPYDFYRVSAYIANDANVKDVLIALNGDATDANYARQDISASGSTLTASRNTGTSVVARRLSTGGIAANGSGSYCAIIAKPSSSVKAQIVHQNSEGTSGADPTQGLTGTEWSNTSAEVTSVALVASSGTFAAGTSFLLEGLSA